MGELATRLLLADVTIRCPSLPCGEIEHHNSLLVAFRCLLGGRSGENVKNVSNQKLRGSRLCRYTFRRLRLAPGESMPWHRDPYHRTLVILGVDAHAIKYRDLSECLTLQPRQLDLDERTARVHGRVHVGAQPCEEIAVFKSSWIGEDRRGGCPGRLRVYRFGVAGGTA